MVRKFTWENYYNWEKSILRKGQHEKGPKEIICLTYLKNSKETSVSEKGSARKENQRSNKVSESPFRAIVTIMAFYSRPWDGKQCGIWLNIWHYMFYVSKESRWLLYWKYRWDRGDGQEEKHRQEGFHINPCDQWWWFWLEW